MNPHYYNFHALRIFRFLRFARPDPILKDHLENGAKNEKMTSWKIQVMFITLRLFDC